MLIVFAYEFPHWKTFNGLARMLSIGVKPDLVLGAPWVDLKIPTSYNPIRKNINSTHLPDLKEVAKNFGIPVVISKHNDLTIEKLLAQLKPELGIILGARILSKSIISSFKLGIINTHPGLLPSNRGLDNLEKAILKKIPQGVTTHFIDSRIDMGRCIDASILNIYEDDSFAEIQMRLNELQIEKLIHTLTLWKEGIYIKSTPLSFSKYTSKLDLNELNDALLEFSMYKKEYQNIISEYKANDYLN